MAKADSKFRRRKQAKARKWHLDLAEYNAEVKMKAEMAAKDKGADGPKANADMPEAN